MPTGGLLCELKGDGEVFLIPAGVFGFGVLIVECGVLKGDNGAVRYLEVNGVLCKESVEVAVHFKLFGDTAVGRVIAVDEDLDGEVVGKV